MPVLEPSTQRASPTRRSRGVLGWIAHAVPTLAAFAVLGAVAWWGHRTGWAMPKFAQLRGETAVAEDWCLDHGVAESECVECNPKLMPRPKPRGWCKTHGVHECPTCHPELAQLATAYAVTDEDRARAARALAVSDRTPNDSHCKKHERRIQFASNEAVEKAGVGADEAYSAPLVETASAPGEIGYDQTRVACLASRAPGTVHRVFRRLGDRVRQGDLLALVEAAEVGKAKSEYLQALVQVDLKNGTASRSIRPGRRWRRRAVQEADAALREARVRLQTGRQALVNLGFPAPPDEANGESAEQLRDRIHFLGLPPELARTLDAKNTTANLLPLRSPQDGVIVSRDVVAGEVVDPARMIFQVVDTSRMWLTLDVQADEAGRLRAASDGAPGQEVRFRPDGSKVEMTGEIVWIATEADPKTRTVKARVELDNGDGRLRANTFGRGEIVLREEPKAVLVPPEAVHWEGCCHVVFVRDRDYFKDGSPKVFHTRSVRVGVTTERGTEVIAGVLPGEVVASKGSSMLRSELLKANLGEG